MKYDYQIEKFLQYYIPKSIFLGCFAKDLIPQQKICNSEYCMLVINLDESSEPGSHFVAMVKHKNNLFLYNSFGTAYYHEVALEPWLSTFVKSCKLKLWKNKIQHQSTKSNVCGYFCIWFLLMFHFYKPNINEVNNFITPLRKVKHSKVNQNVIVNDVYELIAAYVQNEQNNKINEWFV